MVLLWMFGLGITLLGLAGYCGIRYGNAPNKFEFEKFQIWLKKYLRTHPDAEKEEAEAYWEKYDSGAPTEPWLKDRYLLEIKIGKLAIPIFATIGSIVTAIASIL